MFYHQYRHGGLHRRNCLRPGAGDGFTLIEMLVAVSIIALLVALLLPALRSARDHARAVTCASNLHQLGVTFHTYASDQDDWIPHPSENQWGRPFPGEWFMFYSPYLTTSLMSPGPRNLYELGRMLPVFDCPSTSIEFEICYCGPDGPGYNEREKTFDYMLGYAGSIPGAGLTGARISFMRSDYILLIDHQADQSWVAQNTPSGQAWNCYYPGTGSIPYVPGYHHNNGANILTVDGSAGLHSRDVYQPDWRVSHLRMKEYLSQ